MWFQTEVQTEIKRKKEEEIKINEKSERAKRKEEERVKIVQQLDIDKLNILHTEVINYFQLLEKCKYIDDFFKSITNDIIRNCYISRICDIVFDTLPKEEENQLLYFKCCLLNEKIIYHNLNEFNTTVIYIFYNFCISITLKLKQLI